MYSVYSVSCLTLRTSHLMSQQQPQQPPPPTQNAIVLPIKDHFKTNSHTQPNSANPQNQHTNKLSHRNNNCAFLCLQLQISHHPMRFDSYTFLVFQVCNQPHCVFIYFFFFFFLFGCRESEGKLSLLYVLVPLIRSGIFTDR